MLKSDAEAVVLEQHTDQQFRITRRSVDGAVERHQMPPQSVELHEPVTIARSRCPSPAASGWKGSGRLTVPALKAP